MKKVGVFILLSLFLFSFVSASSFSLNFGEWFGKITGNVVTTSEGSNLVSNSGFDNGLTGWGTDFGGQYGRVYKTVNTEGTNRYGYLNISTASNISCWPGSGNPSHCNSFIKSFGRVGANESYIARAKIRSDTTDKIRLVLIASPHDSGVKQSFSPANSSIYRDTGWVQVETAVLTTDAAHRDLELRIYIDEAYKGNHALSVDDVEVVRVTAVAEQTCTDSDGGINLSSGGIVISTQGNQWADSCSIQSVEGGTVTVQNCSGSSCYVSETSCSYYDSSQQTFDGVFYSWINCANGCSNGACIQDATSICRDSDSGKDLFVKGTISGTQRCIEENGGEYEWGEGQVIYDCTDENGEVIFDTKTDSCQTNNTLLEYFCGSDDRITVESSNCVNGCSNGVCLEEVSNPFILNFSESIIGLDIFDDLVAFSYQSYGINKGNAKIFNTQTKQFETFDISGSLLGDLSIYEDLIVYTNFSAYSPFRSLVLYNISSQRKDTIISNHYSVSNPLIYGRNIVYGAYDNNAYKIYSFNLNTQTENLLYSNSVGNNFPPQFAIYNNLIAWIARENSQSAIYLHDIQKNTTEILPVVISSGKEYLSLYGDKLVWIDSRYGNQDIFMYDLSKKEEKRITADTHFRNFVFISGNFIVWRDFRNDQNKGDIFMYDLSKKEEKRITLESVYNLGNLRFYNDTIVWVAGNSLYVYTLSISQDPEEPEEPEECTPQFSCIIDPLICPANGIQTKTCSDVACDSESYTETINCNPGVCAGCQYDEKCIPYGFRFADVNDEPSYCEVNGQIFTQKKSSGDGEWAKCQNNYECDSNICSSGECIDLNALAKEAGAFAQLWSKISCNLADIFGIEDYSTCMSDRFARYA